jgi:hypothetical protein
VPLTSDTLRKRFDYGESVLLGELRECAQFVFKATPLQANQGLTAKLVHEQEHLIPGELGQACREFFERDTLSFLNECQ